MQLDDWLQTPPGQLLAAWEQTCLDDLLADVFGYNALQMGVPALDTLQANRMPQRWLALTNQTHLEIPEDDEDIRSQWPGLKRVALATSSAALPFVPESIDLLVLPHSLELSPDPHATLREAHRVLVHEGRVVITGFNPWSLWGWRQRRTRWYRRLGYRGSYLPSICNFVGPGRVRDWLLLLGFEPEQVRHGIWYPALHRRSALSRMRWLQMLGQRWWRPLGAAYCLMAVKRTRGVHPLGQGWRKLPLPAKAPAILTPSTEASHTRRRS